jgi:hypothetical protein
MKVEIGKWYNERDEYILPFEHCIVELTENHEWLSLESVKTKIQELKEIERIIVISVKDSTKLSATFVLSSWNDKSSEMYRHFQCRSNLVDFKVKSEYCESYVRKINQTKNISKNIGL